MGVVPGFVIPTLMNGLSRPDNSGAIVVDRVDGAGNEVVLEKLMVVQGAR